MTADPAAPKSTRTVDEILTAASDESRAALKVLVVVLSMPSVKNALLNLLKQELVKPKAKVVGWWWFST